jgi:hypothetical protein
MSLLSISLVLTLFMTPTLDPSGENARLRTDLIWVFGGRQQRGWGIYEPLIASLIETDSKSKDDPLGFARAVAAWQRRNQLIPSGVIDHETWITMVGGWQEKRLRQRALPPPVLVTVDPVEFYHWERPAELRQVERETYLAYRRMYDAAKAELGFERGSPFLKIISAYRNRAYQEMLRRQDPAAGRTALAYNSPHFTGRSLDLYVGGEPVITRDCNRAWQTSTRAYAWLVRNAKSFGFEPYFYEPWHWEYIPDETGAQGGTR